jgi:metallo-beta-lactamase class B
MLVRFFFILLGWLGASLAGVAQAHPDWTTNHAPFRIMGNLYYVGSEDLAAYFIATPQGHILLNENLASSVSQICQNIEALGFKPAHIRLLLNGQAHYDHTGGTADFKRLTHAQVAVMAGDVAAMETGGRDDFFFYKDSSAWFKPVKVDRVLHDGSQVKLGTTVLTAHLTAGHTKGTTTWTLDLAEAGRTYHVVIVGGAGINEGNNLVNDPKYPTQAQDFAKTFRALRALPCDVFLGAHGLYFGLKEKYARLKTSKTNPFIDPAGYRAFVAEREQIIRAELAKQLAQHQPGRRK